MTLALAERAARQRASPPPTWRTKRAALNRARDAQVEAQRNLAEAPPDTSPSERAALQAAVRQAGDDVAVAQADLNASIASASATREAGRDAVAKAGPTGRARRGRCRRRAARSCSPSGGCGSYAPRATPRSRRLVTRRRPREARGTAADVARLARKMGIQVPADEVLFFSTLPLRVDSVRVRRGDSVTGRVMTVSNSRLAIDSSLSLNDAKLVRPGATVKIEEPDLGVKTTGVVSQVADRPGTHKVDPGRVYSRSLPTPRPRSSSAPR